MVCDVSHSLQVTIFFRFLFSLTKRFAYILNTASCSSFSRTMPIHGQWQWLWISQEQSMSWLLIVLWLWSELGDCACCSLRTVWLENLYFCNVLTLASPSCTPIFSGVIACGMYDYEAAKQVSVGPVLRVSLMEDESLSCSGTICYLLTCGILSGLCVIAVVLSLIVVYQSKNVCTRLIRKSSVCDAWRCYGRWSLHKHECVENPTLFSQFTENMFFGNLAGAN